jgi:hypothetical protein
MAEKAKPTVLDTQAAKNGPGENKMLAGCRHGNQWRRRLELAGGDHKQDRGYRR